MLSPLPAFLPLQPLAGTLAAMRTTSTDFAGPVSPLALPESCSVSSLRQGFQPFPLRPSPASRLSFVTLGSDEAEERSPEPFLRELVVRPMKRADVERVKRLQDDCLPVSFPASFYTVLLTNPSSLCLVAYAPSDPSTILGTVAASISFSIACSLSSDAAALPSVYILSLAVSPSARRQGLALHLLQAVGKALLPTPLFLGFKQRVNVKLHVEAGNAAALRLYKKIGLVEKSRRRGFYSRLQGGGNGEAVEMEGVLVV
ncbi:hypothetical protein JCM8097_009559 [Rhodosporidiobolus ruineniae]